MRYAHERNCHRWILPVSGCGVASCVTADPSESAEAAAELDELGFTALWIPDVGGPVFDAVGHLLAATKRTVIATGILNLWMHTPGDVADIVCGTDGRARRPLPAGYRGQPRAADRRRQPRAIPQTSGGDGIVFGRVGRCAAAGSRRAASARRAWSENAVAVRKPRRAERTLTSSRPSTPLRPARLWARGRCYCRNRRVILPIAPRKHTASEPTGCDHIWRCRTTPTTCCAAGSPKTI